TAPIFDSTHASVVNQRPSNGATGVPPDRSIVLFFNDFLNSATVPGALHILQNGQLVSGTIDVSGNGQTVQFTPTTAWSYGALVQVLLDSTATNNAGVPVYTYQASFTTAADPNTAPPAVV